jgi:hypothetical protein
VFAVDVRVCSPDDAVGVRTVRAAVGGTMWALSLFMSTRHIPTGDHFGRVEACVPGT